MHPIIARVLFVLIGILIGGLSVVTQNIYVRAASEPVQACQPWGKAGQWTLYKCEGDDGILCLHSDSGFMQCRLD